MSSNWPTQPLGAILDHVIDHRGKTPKKMKFEGFHTSGYPVLSAKHVKTDRLVNQEAMRYSNEAMYKKWMKVETQEGDIVLTSEAPLGQIYYLDGKTKYLLGQRVFGLRPNKEKVNPLYLAAWLASPKSQSLLEARATGSTVLGIKQAELLKIEVDIPPEDIQETIARNRYDLVKKIELNTQTNQTLEQIAQALFKSWFVDFDPVKAKIAALNSLSPWERDGVRAKELANLAAMSAIAAKSPKQLAELKQTKPADYQQLTQTAALFPSAMQDSELGEIPEGWEVDKISDFGAIVCGKTPPKSKPGLFGSNIPFIKIPDMHNSMFVVRASEYLSQAGAESQPNKNIPRGGICVSSIATVGKVVIAREQSRTNQQINSILPHEDFYTPYLYFYMGLLEKHFHDLASGGSATLNMNTSIFSKITVLKPSDDALLSFFETTKATISLIESNLLSNLTLGEMRDTLLPKLLSGEINLKSEVSE